MKPNRSLRAFGRRLFARTLLAVLLYLLQLGPPLIADEQNDLAKLSSLNKQHTELYQAGKFNDAIPVAQEFLELSEKALGPDHPDTAMALSNLALLYSSMGDYAKAEPLYQRALKIYEKALGPDHPDTARSLNNLAALYDSMGDYAKAEPLYQRALKITEKALGPDHPDTATALNNLAGLYRSMGDYAKAEPLYRRALKITRKRSAPITQTPHGPQQSGGALSFHGRLRQSRTALSARVEDPRESPRPRSPRHRHRPQQSGGAV